MGLFNSIIGKIKYRASDNYKYLNYWYSCDVDKHSIMLEPGRGETVSGSIFALLKEIETSPEWADYTPYFIVTDKTRSEAAHKIDSYGFKRVQLVTRLSDEYLKLLAGCGYFFTDNTYPPMFCRKTDQTLVSIWHGTPLKHMGKAALEGARGISNIQRNYFMCDYALFPNVFTRDVFMGDYMLKTQFSSKVLMLDYPRSDAFFDDEMRRRVCAEQGLDGLRIYAYMPTWRGTDALNVSREEQLAEIEGYLSQFDSALDDEEILFVNLHPFVGSMLNYDRYSHIRPFPAEYETYDFLNVSDALITDYSSVMFDYAQTGRSVVLFAYDLEDYMGSRGTYFELQELPFDICRTADEVVGSVRRNQSTATEDFLERFCAHRSPGQSCSRTLLRIAVKGDGLTEEEQRYCSIETPERNDKRVHLIVESELENELIDAVKESIANHLSEGEHVTLAFCGGIMPETIAPLRELEEFEETDFYSLIGGVRSEDIPREVQRVFPGWHVDSVEIPHELRVSYIRLVKHLILADDYCFADRGDNIVVSFRHDRLSYMKNARVGGSEYEIESSGKVHSITIPKEALASYSDLKKIELTDIFGNTYRLTPAQRLFKRHGEIRDGEVIIKNKKDMNAFIKKAEKGRTS